jgi:outer membrane autotransporter protein
MFFLFSCFLFIFVLTASCRRRFFVTKIQPFGFAAAIFFILTIRLFANSLYDEVSLIRDLDLDWKYESNYCNDNSFVDPDKKSELPSTDYETFLAQSKRGSGGCLWGNLYYSDTTLKPKNSSTKIQPDNFGFQIGLDVLTGHEVYSTFMININESKIKFNKYAKSTTDNFLFTYSKVYHWQIAHAGLGVGIGYDRYSLSVAGQKISGNGLQSRLDGELGLSFIFRWWEIKPFYALQYNFLYHGEINSSAVNAIGDWNGHGLTQFVGIRFNWKPLENVLLLQSRVTWIHELLDNPPPFYASHFSSIKGKGASTPSILFFDGNIGRDWVWVGLGLKWSFLHQRSLFVDYDAMINSRQTTHLVNIGLCLGW